MLSACASGGRAAWNSGSNYLSAELLLRWFFTYLWEILGTDSQHHSCLDTHKQLEHHKLTAGCPVPILPLVSIRDLSVQINPRLALEGEIPVSKDWAVSLQRNKPQEHFATQSSSFLVSMQISCFLLSRMKVKCYIETYQVVNLS